MTKADLVGFFGSIKSILKLLKTVKVVTFFSPNNDNHPTLDKMVEKSFKKVK